jgi:hypothetical protein
VKDLSIEELRILIGQDIGLRFIIPLALAALRHNKLAEGDLYEGDLPMSVLTSDANYWRENRSNWQELCELMATQQALLETAEVGRSIRMNRAEAFAKFKAM